MGYQQDGKQTDDQANQAHFESCSRIKVQRLFVRLHAGRGGGRGREVHTGQAYGQI